MRLQRIVISLLASLACGVWAISAMAQETEFGEEALFFTADQSVVTASKRTEKLIEAPAIMTVITADEIERMGADNLYDVLRYVPGVSVMETYYGYSSVTFRGIAQTHYNDKSLLLINGHHPLYDVVVGSYYLEQIPINVIKRIEIIRGPGSVLYGTNAFAGVINVITKDGRDLDGGRASLKYGSFDTVNGTLAYGGESNDVDFLIGGSYKDTSGYDFKVQRDEAGASGTIPYEEDYGNVFVSSKCRDIALRGMFFKNSKDKYGIVPALTSTGERDLLGWDLDAAYEKNLSDSLGLNAYAWYDYLEKKEQLDHYPPSSSGVEERQEYAGHKWGTEVQLSYDVHHDANIMCGVVYEGFLSEPYLFVYSSTDTTDSTASPYTDDKRLWDVSPYLQVKWKPVPKLGLVGGLRYDSNSDSGSNFSPRGGAVYEIWEDALFLKALYGQAYRSPSVFEKYVTTPNVLMGNPDLNPENVSTFDFGVQYLVNKHSLEVNYFYLTTKDMITRNRTVPAGQQGCTRSTPQYGNAEGQRIQGLEAELKGSPHKGVSYFCNVSYKLSGEEKSTGADILYMERVLANLGISWQPIPKIELGSFLNYVGSRKGTLSQAQGGTATKIDPYLLWNLKATLRPAPSVEVSLIVDNLLDESYTYPEYIRRNIEDVPGGPGRALFAETVYHF